MSPVGHHLPQGPAAAPGPRCDVPVGRNLALVLSGRHQPWEQGGWTQQKAFGSSLQHRNHSPAMTLPVAPGPSQSPSASSRPSQSHPKISNITAPPVASKDLRVPLTPPQPPERPRAPEAIPEPPRNPGERLIHPKALQNPQEPTQDHPSATHTHPGAMRTPQGLSEPPSPCLVRIFFQTLLQEGLGPPALRWLRVLPKTPCGSIPCQGQSGSSVLGTESHGVGKPPSRNPSGQHPVMAPVGDSSDVTVPVESGSVPPPPPGWRCQPGPAPRSLPAADPLPAPTRGVS